MRFSAKLTPAVTLLFLLLIANVLTVNPALAQRQSLDKIVAIVDDDVVLQSELDRRLTEISQQSAGQQLPNEEQIRSEALEMLVMENLQMQFAERVSIRFDDDTLNRVMGNMAEQNNMTFNQYVSALEDADMYLQTREEIRKQLTLRELQRGVVNSRIAITDQEIENFLNSENGKAIMAAEYLVDHILIPASTERDSAATINKKLQYGSELVARIKDGEPLAAVRLTAQQNGEYSLSGTQFDWRKADGLPSLFTDVVPGMKQGDVAGPIRAGNGFHIIQLVDKRGGTEQIVNQTHIRHIMLVPNEIRNENQTISAINRLRQRIIDGEDFATLARQNSDDASSVVAGGDLDWINEGGLPPEMESVISELDEGELSEVFRSGTGWHIAEVLGRRESDLSREFSRSQAENALRNRKFDLELQNWLIEIRDQAFVEFID